MLRSWREGTLSGLEEEYLSIAFALGSLYEEEGGQEGVKKVKLGKKEEINVCVFFLSKYREINLKKLGSDYRRS